MFEVRPLTEETWADLEDLFDLPGGSIVRGCWCMFYRTAGPVSVSKAAGPGHKQELHTLVRSGVTPGLVGYANDTPVGWISLGPREDYRKLERSRIMKAVDDSPVWSIVCTYVAKSHRGHGHQHKLLAGAMTSPVSRECACSRRIRSTNRSAAMTISCSSDPGVCTRGLVFERSYVARRRGWG